jgi:hypothetical protein
MPKWHGKYNDFKYKKQAKDRKNFSDQASATNQYTQQ